MAIDRTTDCGTGFCGLFSLLSGQGKDEQPSPYGQGRDDTARRGNRRASPGTSKETSQFKTTAGRPKKQYYTDKTDEAEAEFAEASSGFSGDGLNEQSLYPLLTAYLKNELSVFSRD